MSKRVIKKTTKDDVLVSKEVAGIFKKYYTAFLSEGFTTEQSMDLLHYVASYYLRIP